MGFVAWAGLCAGAESRYLSYKQMGVCIAIRCFVKGQTTPAFGPEDEFPVYSDQEHCSLCSCKTTGVPSRLLLRQAHGQEVHAFCP